jgi:hypothetical protein
MPVATTASFEPESEQTELTIQDLPTIPTVKDMETWDADKVLRWIQLTVLDLLKGDNLDSFKKANFFGLAFLISDAAFFQRVGVSRGRSRALEGLVNKVKKGSKSIQWT